MDNNLTIYMNVIVTHPDVWLSRKVIRDYWPLYETPSSTNTRLVSKAVKTIFRTGNNSIVIRLSTLAVHLSLGIFWCILGTLLLRLTTLYLTCNIIILFDKVLLNILSFSFYRLSSLETSTNQVYGIYKTYHNIGIKVLNTCF